VNAILKERIGERVSALKISWRRASLEAGLEAGFIQDLITGRSQHPSEDAVTSLATVLKCSSVRIPAQSGQVFRFEVGQHSGMKPDTVPINYRTLSPL
jgi:hypothetical protein